MIALLITIFGYDRPAVVICADDRMAHRHVLHNPRYPRLLILTQPPQVKGPGPAGFYDTADYIGNTCWAAASPDGDREEERSAGLPFSAFVMMVNRPLIQIHMPQWTIRPLTCFLRI